MTAAANTAISGTATAPDAGQILNEIERNEKFLFALNLRCFLHLIFQKQA